MRAAKPQVGRLITLEARKIISEGHGEVQEMIDICDFAVGLSRQLYGLSIATERPEHRMMEAWHLLGVAGVITAFNFPAAVWSWNAALALVCGNSLLWKPSEKTPLTALAVQQLLNNAIALSSDAPPALSTVLIDDRKIGEAIADDPRVPVVSAIAALGTADQRCTTLRRLFVHESVHDALPGRLERAYGSVALEDPCRSETLVGPVIDAAAGQSRQAALTDVCDQGAHVFGGKQLVVAGLDAGTYAQPVLVRMPAQTATMQRETFAPILYALPFRDLDEAIRLHNDVPQGLSSSIFNNDLCEAEQFLSIGGSGCGIANVSIGPSGAKIGGAFGGEEETGGAREAGSDCLKAYMRRATNTVNFGRALPLAQSITFEVPA